MKTGRKAETVLAPREVVCDDVDLSKPGIFEWRVDGIGVYIGESNRMTRVLPHYDARVRKLLNQDPDEEAKDFRFVYHALVEGIRKRRQITLTFLENLPAKSDRIAATRELVEGLRREQATGGLPVLNCNYRLTA